MSKNSMILILVFSMLTFLSSLICAILVFSNESARTTLNSNKVLASTHTYKNISITYKENNTFSINNLNPGEQVSKTFTITNNNSDQINYSIIWYDITSNWHNANEYGITHPEEFVYSLNCSNGEKMDNIEMPNTTNTSPIIENLILDTNKTNTCIITMSFLKIEAEEQLYNLNKSFGGTYKIIIEK